MARTGTAVDRQQLEDAIRKAEAKGPLRTQSEVFKKAATIYNCGKVPAKITHSVVMLRVNEWGVELKTPKARGRKAAIDDKMNKKIIQAIKEAEKEKTFDTQSALWEHVAAKLDVKPHNVYQTYKAAGITIKTQSARGKGKRMTQAHRDALISGRANRRPRSERFKSNPDLQRSFELLRQSYPDHQNLVNRVEKGSISAAVKLNCLQCCGFQKVEIKLCSCPECPLWAFRPYQKATVVEGAVTEEGPDVEIDEEAEVDTNVA